MPAFSGAIEAMQTRIPVYEPDKPIPAGVDFYARTTDTAGAMESKAVAKAAAHWACDASLVRVFASWRVGPDFVISCGRQV